MPYSVQKIKGGWKVIKNDDPSYVLHKKPHKTKKQAIKQMHAIILNEHAKNHGEQGGVLPFLSLLYNAVPIRKDFSSRIKNLLKQFGDQQINKITIFRKPVQGFVNTTLNIASLGQWGKMIKKYGIDRVFHLYMVAFVGQNNTPVVVEKNEIINVQLASAKDIQPENGQSMTVTKQIPVGLTINQMLQKAKSSMGIDRFWQYNAFTNNCQSFIKYILSANGLLDNNLLDFIDQNIESIANESLSAPVRYLVDKTTTLASKIKTLTGRGLMLY